MNGNVTTDVDRAVEVIGNGGLVAIPTETVYGLAGDARDDEAVRRIFAVKGRPADHPLIVHVAAAEDITRWVSSMSPQARILAATCWPGPLTLLLLRGPQVSALVTGGRDTVGLRVPAHPMTTELLQRTGTGLAAPSANRFGKVSPTTAQHVADDLGDDVDLILDGGPCPIGVESTIVDCSISPPQLLRPGGIPMEEIDALLDWTLTAPSGPSRAAGMLASHYAPTARVVLADSPAVALGLMADDPTAELLDGTSDLAAYAHDLYDRLRDADTRGVSLIVAVMPPPVGLGHAIRDRLTKAAHRD